MSTNSDRTVDDGGHDWLRRHLVPYAAALLDPADETRLQEHLSRCPECAERHRLLLESKSGVGEHIPASLIARWNVEQDRLQGLERAMVARHLAHCEACRADLEILGYETRLRTAPVSSAGRPAQVVDLGAERARRRAVKATPLTWLTMGGGWAAAAALTFVLLRQPTMVSVIQGPATPSVTGSVPTEVATVTPPTSSETSQESAGPDNRAAGPETPPSTSGETGSAGRARGWPSDGPSSEAGGHGGIGFPAAVSLGTLGGASRGGADGATVIDAGCPRAGYPLVLHWDAAEFAEPVETPVGIEVIGPSRFHQHWQTTAGELKDHAAIQVFPDGDRFAPGLYTIRFVKHPASAVGAPDTLQVALRLRRPAADLR